VAGGPRKDRGLMNVLLLTNTYRPHVGGVARSVETLARELRRRGHGVLVGAPSFTGGEEERDEGVVRFPAVQHFNGSDFSVPMPVPGRLSGKLRRFGPDLVHSHHPFLLGDTALRVAAARRLPVVFTHHTLYERYTHYVPRAHPEGVSPRLEAFTLQLVTGYANLCDAVIAPSASIEALLRERGVKVPIRVIPTGVDLAFFAGGDGRAFRAGRGLSPEAFVVGHVGRLAPEKNLAFLARAVVRFLRAHPQAHFAVVGEGPSRQEIAAICTEAGVGGRFHAWGVLEGPELAGAYRAFDAFAFASRTETQGLVLAEAMAAGVPVVAIDAPGVREVVTDEINGRLLPGEDPEAFAAALAWVRGLGPEGRGRLGQALETTAREFARETSVDRTLDLYRELRGAAPAPRKIADSPWAAAREMLAEEWKILRNMAHAVEETFHPEESPSPAPTSWKARALGLLWTLFLHLQRSSWRLSVEGEERLDACLRSPRGAILVFWHGKYMPLFVLLRRWSGCVFTSRSFRGGVVAEICRRFGYRAVSLADHGGDDSLVTMRRALAEIRVGAVAVDGPLGPYHAVKRGALQLASELDIPLLPVTVAARRKRISTHRWDRFEVPRFFTRVALVAGDPVEVPSPLTSGVLPSWQDELHDRLEALDRRAEALVAADSSRPSPQPCTQEGETG